MDDRRAWVVVVVAAWELVAILTGRLPTITHVVHRWRTHKTARLGIWLVLGWLVEHLFGEGRGNGQTR